MHDPSCLEGKKPFLLVSHRHSYVWIVGKIRTSHIDVRPNEGANTNPDLLLAQIITLVHRYHGSVEGFVQSLGQVVNRLFPVIASRSGAG